MRFILGVLFWIKLWVITIAMFLGLCGMRVVFACMRWQKFDLFCHRYAVCWAKAIFCSTPGWSVQISGKENLPHENARFVLVSNHESMTDIWVIFLLELQFRWLAKAELFKIPFIGPPMKWAGYIPIDRGNKESHNKALTDSAASINSGVPMLFFPEGTRSDDGQMRPFKIGAFKLASDTNASILPIVLKGARQLIPKGSWLPSASQVRVQVLPMMHRLEGEDFQDFATRTRNVILDAYQKM